MAGIYLHIPFCKRRCIYCDFFSSTCAELKESYVKALCKELDMRKDYIEENDTIQTIYFGGGTPSQLSGQELEQIFSYIYKIYNIDANPEITLEANPDDLSIEYINLLRALPVNRLSMGIQTFNEERLQLLHRRHSARQAIEAVRNCQAAGFNNISIDLIYGLPGETLADWKYDLEQASQLNVQHISAYHLTYEEGTALWNLLKTDKIKEIDEDTSVLLYTTLVEYLKQAGFTHYEISNFCRPGFHSRHNSSYWQGKKYLGCGASAHSYNSTSRQWNISSLNEYIRGIEENALVFECETLNIYTRYNDCIVTSLRTIWGLSLLEIKNNFGEKLYNYCLKMARPHLEQGTLEIKDNVLRLTSQGVFLSDGIMSDLLWVE